MKFINQLMLLPKAIIALHLALYLHHPYLNFVYLHSLSSMMFAVLAAITFPLLSSLLDIFAVESKSLCIANTTELL